jgi:hypothetical protein
MEPQIRIGDAEREQVVTALQEYLTEGYLSVDEFSERSAAAYRAKTRGELAVLTEDLAPRTDLAPNPSRDVAGRATGWRSWTPAVIAVVVLVGLVVVAVGVTIVVMMLGMMGMMG